MPATVHTRFITPQLWSEQDSLRTGLDTIALIKARTMKGISSTGARFKRYSTKPIYISRDAFPSPKGGEQVGDSVYYKGGYREYKRSSRGTSRTAEVDLTLTGNLMNGLQIIKHDRLSFTIGLIQQVRHYGYRVNEERPYIGLTEREVKIITKTINMAIGRKLRR